MIIVFALIGTLGVVTLAAFLIYFGYGAWWFASHARTLIGLDRDRIKELYEQDAGVQNVFFVVKCVLAIYIGPIVLFQGAKNAFTNYRIDRHIRRTVLAKYPEASIIRERQGEKEVYRVRLEEGDDEFTCTN